MQRHRMLTCQWQSLGARSRRRRPRGGPRGGRRRRVRPGARDLARPSSHRLEAAGLPEAAPYALCLGYRIRYVLDMNAREAMHVCELRSGREGHPTYRAVAQAMHEQISAVHPAIGAAMRHVDSSSEPRLERIMSEIRTHRKRAALAQVGQVGPAGLPPLLLALPPLDALGRASWRSSPCRGRRGTRGRGHSRSWSPRAASGRRRSSRRRWRRRSCRSSPDRVRALAARLSRSPWSCSGSGTRARRRRSSMAG